MPRDEATVMSVPSDGDRYDASAASVHAASAGGGSGAVDHAHAPDIGASGLRAFTGLFAGFALLAIVDAGAIAFGVPRPLAGASLRAQHHLWDAAETLGVGAIQGAIVGGFSARVRLPIPAEILAYAAMLAPITYLSTDDDLRRQASVALEGRLENVIFAVFLVLVALAVPAAHALGAFLSRFPRVRFLPAAIAVGAMIADQMHLRDDYFAAHATIAWAAATLAGASLAPLAERAARALARGRNGRVALGAALALALFGIVVPPPNAVRYELFRQPCAVAPWALATVVWPMPHARAKAPDLPWIPPPGRMGSIPASTPRALPQNLVAVLITVDAMRADPIADPKNDSLFPTFAEMKRRGVYFTHAVAPGSQTAVSLTSTFAGRYFSELRWSLHGTGSTRFLYAADDDATRFPELLTKGGVGTASFDSINFLAGEFGVARGFREEHIAHKDRRHGLAREVLDPMIRRLEKVGNEPFFTYAHLMEPHAPYDRGRREGSQRDRYLSEIGVADAQIGKVLRTLEQRFPGRWLLIVSADHGEAFGEHETFQHTKTLYEELTRVPLLMLGPGLEHRVIDERVSLVDLGPTLLDLFGLPTPLAYSGRSLARRIAGREPAMPIPVFAEGRLRRAMWSPDGLKVIVDLRRKVIEAYDLTRDPGETRNLYTVEPERVDAALAMLEAYFAARGVHGGHHPPYKP
jgi:hypothetical protein